jgi:Methyltransferase domain
VKSSLENALFDPDINENWHMSFSERAALMYALSRTNPDVSIEIGTFLGGSLRSIAAASRHVYTFDLDDRTIPGMSNVSFVAGDSSKTLPPIIDEINASDREINFILIDGDHSETGVKNDIANCLRYRPKKRATIILMHDSSNPAVRKGIRDAPWAGNPYVHGIELDLVAGVLFNNEELRGQIWGGLAVAVVLPEKRSGDVYWQASFEHARSILLEKSIYVGAN